MSDERTNEYAKDIETIKSLMVAYDERTIVEHWVFFIYAAFAGVGTTLSVVLVRQGSLDTMALLVEVWLPLFVVAATLETIGFLRQLRKSGVLILPRRTRKFLVAAGGIMVVLTWFLLRSVPDALTPGLILAYAAVPLFIYAHGSYGQLFVEAFFLLAAAIVTEVAGWRGINANALAGMAAMVVYTVAGIHSKRCEQAN